MQPAKDSALPKSIAPSDPNRTDLRPSRMAASSGGANRLPRMRQQQLTAPAPPQDSAGRDTSGQQEYKAFLRVLTVIAAVPFLLVFLPIGEATNRLKLLGWAIQHARRPQPDARTEAPIYAIMFAGMVLYGATTGVNLCKVDTMHDTVYVGAAPANYMAMLFAFAQARARVLDRLGGGVRPPRVARQ